ncbi:hypothetical protein LOD99_3356 [Oopsacas minuta]|uniref:Uncharacterized protein n=1 Tax=Oopsacas minuta TaxID=111878 RepID=A0AAV7JZR3_9METZ|nr:hypothetical protein LOD99_3356 [Oopsacas minuta]
MYTVHRDFDRSPYPTNHPIHFTLPKYSSEIPIHEEAVNPCDDDVPLRPPPLRGVPLPRREEFDSPLSPKLEEDLLSTLIVAKETKTMERTKEPPSPNLPSGVVDLLISLESLSQSLSLPHKQSLSQQLTRLSYSLQTDCLYPENDQQWQTPTNINSNPPQITPRKSGATSQDLLPNSHVITPSALSSDWSGPGSFDHQKPTQLELNPNHQRSVSVQYDTQRSFLRQTSGERIYANMSSTPCTTPGNSDPLAPPLPPRDHFVSKVEYHNVPATRGPNMKTDY